MSKIMQRQPITMQPKTWKQLEPIVSILMVTICFHENYDMERCYHTKSIQIPESRTTSKYYDWWWQSWIYWCQIWYCHHGHGHGHTYNFNLLMTWAHFDHWSRQIWSFYVIWPCGGYPCFDVRDVNVILAN